MKCTVVREAFASVDGTCFLDRVPCTLYLQSTNECSVLDFIVTLLTFYDLFFWGGVGVSERFLAERLSND